jgi:hypothetical protein
LVIKEQRTIPVHALGDERMHLALPHHGRLRQGRLKTLCGKQAVSELQLFASIAAKSRCRACFAKVDEHGYLRDEGANGAARAALTNERPGGSVASIAIRKNKRGPTSD